MDAERGKGVPIAAVVEEQKQPLIVAPQQSTPCETPPKKKAQAAIRKTLKITGNLANLLPSGSLLAFYLISPIFTPDGNCHTWTSKYLTLSLLLLCSLSCFLLCFTDSYKDEKGKVWYCVATFRGLWIIDGPAKVPVEQAKKYKLSVIDFFHAFLSVMVFAAIAFFDRNVVECLFPNPSNEAKDLVSKLPMAVGVVASLCFTQFPTKRHGIGYPLSKT